MAIIKPMLAKEYNHNIHITFPVFTQPKLDGIRCIASMVDGKVELRTRTGKIINTLPLIEEEVRLIYERGNINKEWSLDGELMGPDFESLCSIVKRKEVHEDHVKIWYALYDIINKDKQEDRIHTLHSLDAYNPDRLYIVNTHIALNTRELNSIFKDNIDFFKYEGTMIRSMDGLYEHKRSNNLLKYKEFEEEEFKIIDCIEGKGKLKGLLGAFKCVTEEGIEFTCKMATSEYMLYTYWKNRDLLIGKELTVKYQNKTKKGAPRFPVGVIIRDYE